MKKLLKVLFSMPTTGVLLLFAGIAIAYATILEKDFGTLTSRALIYNAWWFELLFVLIAITLIASIFVYKMIENKQWGMMMFHLAFVVMILGSGITRYFGYEGVMHIREGQKSNTMVSSDTYITCKVSDGEESLSIEDKVIFDWALYNDYSRGFGFKDHQIKITNQAFVPNAEKILVETTKEEPLALNVIVSDPMHGRQNIFLKEGEVAKFNGFDLALNNPNASVNFIPKGSNNELFLQSSDTMLQVTISGAVQELIIPDTSYNVALKTMYKVNRTSIIVLSYYDHAKQDLASVPVHNNMYQSDAIKLKLEVDGEESDVFVFGGKEQISRKAIVQKEGLDFEFTYGAKLIELPFELELKDFVVERYAGSHSPSSFVSKVNLIDTMANLSFDYDIYMNHVLNYASHRFFQSSYDRDEKGTFLSVNYDFWGTVVTYLGYLFMLIGILLTPFNKKSYIRELIKLSSKYSKRMSVLVLLMSFFSFNNFAYSSPEISVDNDEESNLFIADKATAEAFSSVLVLDFEGRIKPIHTLASELVRKITKSTSFLDLTPDQVLLSMASAPETWSQVEMIKVANPKLQKILGISTDYISYSLATKSNEKGMYKLRPLLEEVRTKKATERNKFDKEIIKLDERINLVYLIFKGDIFKIFPINNNGELTWKFEDDILAADLNQEVIEARNNFSMLLERVRQDVNIKEFNTKIEDIKSFQHKQAPNILPTENKVKLEIWYNKWNIFLTLAKFYALIGFILLVINLIRIFKSKTNFDKILKIGLVLTVLLFLMHTSGLGIRWYISGHAPWSNGYESMLYVAWAAALAGLLFVKRSPITLAITTLLTALILFVAGMSWMDPKITNLVPVLKSYWLVIHVAVITASYGFLALGAVLGFLNLFIRMFRSQTNSLRVDDASREISIIIQISLIIGLYLLTIGTFLGAVWANESWGRYWGWDPKESWALITIIVYTFVTHMRNIKGFRGDFAVSLAAFIAFGSVLMTYFGVNYLLSGLHSYGSDGDFQIPDLVYYLLMFVSVVIIYSYFVERKVKNHSKLETE